MGAAGSHGDRSRERDRDRDRVKAVSVETDTPKERGGCDSHTRSGRRETRQGRRSGSCGPTERRGLVTGGG